jgi:dTDP-glucose 4,6-dehydratase
MENKKKDTGEILILGGNRFVGKRIAEELLSLKFKVTVFNRKGTGPKGCNIIKGNRNNAEDLERIPWENFIIIVDMCLYKPEQFKLIESWIMPFVPYLFISSGAAYKDPEVWPIDEKNELLGMEAFGDYGKEKAEVEKLIKDSDNVDRGWILRPTYIVGKGNHNPRLGHYISKLQNKEPIEVAGNGENIINLVFVEDMIGIIMMLLFSYPREGKIYNVCGSECLTVNSLIDIIADELGIEEINKNYNSDKAIFPSVNYGVFSNEKISEDYNGNFSTLRENLPSYIEWYNNKNKK